MNCRTKVFALFVFVVFVAADTLPTQLSDSEFWRTVEAFSEPDGPFPYENFVSNESSYQMVVSELRRVIPANGVYLGVATEQNFTYIAAMQPKIAFIVDIRRQNMLEHLMYKALFEMSSDRVDFISRLFSRPRPSALTDTSSPTVMFDQFASVAPDEKLRSNTIQLVKDRLVQQHRFALSKDDLDRIEFLVRIFADAGPALDYAFRSKSPDGGGPGFQKLMLTTDADGTNWSFLANREAFERVRELQRKNLIVPLVGDFAGPRTLRAVAAYLKSHGAVVSAFYVSNVEFYLKEPAVWSRWQANLMALPIDAGSRLIRWGAPGIPRTRLTPIVPEAEYTPDLPR
jgi:hypothetical protein